MHRPRHLESWLLALAVVAGYANALPAAFQFDDWNVIVHAPAVHSLQAWAADALHGLRPLLKLSYALNWISGLGALGFHLTNVLIHLGCVLLVHRLGRRLIGAGALWAALLFALHPVQTEAVTYVCGRSVSLMTLLYLASLWAHDESQEGAGGGLRTLSLLGFAAALLVRETALTLPAALLLWDWVRGRTLRQAWAGARWHGALAALALGLAMFHPAYRAFLDGGLQTRTWGAQLAGQATALPYLLSRLLTPWALNLDPDLHAPPWQYLPMAGGVFLAGLAALVAGLRQRSLWAFAGLWVLLHLLPTNSLLPRLDLASERHLYLPMAGLCWGAGAGLQALASRRGLRPLALALCAALGLLTLARNGDYATEVTLWEATVARSPLKPRPHNNLGFAYELEGRIGEAEREYRKALELDPAYGLAQRNLKVVGKRVPWP
jgi:protein O-mannosyl-transferase